MALDAHKAVGVANVLIVGFKRELVRLFLPNVSPDLIAFHVLHGNVHNQPAHDFLAPFPGKDESLRDCVSVQASNPHRGANRVAFNYELHSQQGLFFRDAHLAKGEAMGFGVGLAALRAAEPTKAIAMHADAMAGHIAHFASHCDFGSCHASHDSMINYR
ncbi:MAG TPA: hypothetical protein VN924_21425 [Bryobacteraceae bacterium]|nr:hypothetical protein [Bryobacteraceae bacterium]